jgi:hypothetical protein
MIDNLGVPVRHYPVNPLFVVTSSGGIDKRHLSFKHIPPGRNLIQTDDSNDWIIVASSPIGAKYPLRFRRHNGSNVQGPFLR